VTAISVNRTTCQGYGNCVLALPSVFDVDNDGLVVLAHEDVADADLAALHRAAYDCPTDSITIDE
jgi:ferredoxin